MEFLYVHETSPKRVKNKENRVTPKNISDTLRNVPKFK